MIQYVVNNTYHSSLKSTPSKLLFGYDMRNHSDADLVSTLNRITQIELACDHARNDSRQIATEVSDKIIIRYIMINSSMPSRYNIGDYVLIRDTTLKPGEDRKLKSNYKGPYQVTKVLSNNRFVIQDIPGFNVTPRPYNLIFRIT